MATPHIHANPGDFADVVLMPGDPLRAEHMATQFLKDVKRVNDVRNMFGYTGTYKDKRVSVMAHGMGIPSISIYAYELVKEFGVKTLIRVGSCGALHQDVKLGDIILAAGGSTDSNVNRLRFMGHDFAALPDYTLLHAAVTIASRRLVPVRVGNVFSTDSFYPSEPGIFDVLEKMGVLAAEMEVAGLYGLACEHGVRALGILTVSDHIRREERLTPEQRQKGFDTMIEIALETAIAT